MTDKESYCFWLGVANSRGSNALKSRAMAAINKARAAENKAAKLEKGLQSNLMMLKMAFPFVIVPVIF